MFSSGCNLKYSKKRDQYENSTQSAVVRKYYATSYAEKIIIIKEVNTILGKKTIKFINENRFSVTTSGHYSSLVSHGYLSSSDLTVELNFNGSMNDLDYLTELNLEIIEKYFNKCEYNQDLIEFFNQFLPKKQADKIILERKNKHESELVKAKEHRAFIRLRDNLYTLNYASEKNLMVAFNKYKNLKTYNQKDTFKEFSEEYNLSLNFHRVKQYYNFIKDNNLKLNWSTEKIFNEITEQKNLEIFNELS